MDLRDNAIMLPGRNLHRCRCVCMTKIAPCQGLARCHPCPQPGPTSPASSQESLGFSSSVVLRVLLQVVQKRLWRTHRGRVWTGQGR